MRLTEDEARARFRGARVAHLATADAAGTPHVVPIVFALAPAADVLYTAVDHKPKRTRALHRLADIEANPRVAVLVDAYSDDWARLWWCRADGQARVLPAGAQADHAVVLLRSRYPQYEARPPAGPVVAVEIGRWIGWSASASGGE